MLVIMRYYMIYRSCASRVRYAETVMPTQNPVRIPSAIPKMLDPFLLWKETTSRSQIKHIEVHDSRGAVWFELKTEAPLENFMNFSADALDAMK